MWTRLAVSAVTLPFLVWMFLTPCPVAFTLFATAVAALGHFEYSGMLKDRGLRPAQWVGLVWVALWMVAQWPASWLGPLAPAFARLDGGVLLLGAVLTLSWAHLLRGDAQTGMVSLWGDLFGVLYLGWMASFFIRLRLLPFGNWWIFLLFFYCWVYDAGAYFVGRSLGRRPLSPLSPKKTVEGLVGGVLITVALAALVMPHLLPAGFPMGPRRLMALGLLAALFAQAGDLLESMVKRYSGVKDSGGLFKELGGFLDKMDSPVFTAPLLWWVATTLF